VLPACLKVGAGVAGSTSRRPGRAGTTPRTSRQGWRHPTFSQGRWDLMASLPRCESSNSDALRPCPPLRTIVTAFRAGGTAGGSPASSRGTVAAAPGGSSSGALRRPCTDLTPERRTSDRRNRRRCGRAGHRLEWKYGAARADPAIGPGEVTSVRSDPEHRQDRYERYEPCVHRRSRDRNVPHGPARSPSPAL
jgi:hypothetical protein